MIPRILIIAGSDSGGGAGIQADIKTVTMLGGHAMTAITAITAQNTLGVEGVHTLPPRLVVQQMACVAEDIGVDAVKIGMIGGPETVNAVADELSSGLYGVPIVFDPVMVATSGSVLADDATIAAMDRLARMAMVVTPNLPELAVLTGSDVASPQSALSAARDYAARIGAMVLIKGGHAGGDTVIDRLVDASGEVARWDAPRIDTTSTHGTGCTFASALAAGLGAGMPVAHAFYRAVRYVRLALRAAPGLGSGHGPVGHNLGHSPFDELERDGDA